MTCHELLSLLDGYIDSELPPSVKAAVDDHVAACPACADQLVNATRLRELLPKLPVPDPGRQYFDELRSLVFARTIESSEINEIDYDDAVADTRSSFVRSLISVAAAIGLFFLALSIGSRQNRIAPPGMRAEDPRATSSLVAMASSRSEIPQDRQQRERMLSGTIMLGAPGTLGRAIEFHTVDEPE